MAELEFDALKADFGTDGNAHLLTFGQFCALPDERAHILIGRVEDFVRAGSLAELRQKHKAGR